MKRFLFFLSVIVILSLLLASPGCKKWEGRYYISEAACETRYHLNTNESKFAVGIKIANEENKGVGAIFADWDFEVYDGDEDLLLKINRSNYDTLEFLITVFAVTPIPDSSYRGFPGLLNVLTGRGVDAWRILGDIFNGKIPKKLKYTLTLLDDNNYVSTLSGELSIMHVTD